MNFAEALKRYRFRLLFVLVLIGALYYPVVVHMAGKWYKDPNYSHGFLIPLVAAYVVFRKSAEMKGAPVEPHDCGLVVLSGSLLAFVAAHLGAESFTMGMTLILTLGGTILYLFGKKAVRILAFPLAYLFFMIPLPYTVYNAVAFPLKLLVARYSVLFLKAIGIVVWREGNIIMFPNTALEVADACSGMRSLVSLLALSAVVAYFTQKAAVNRGIVILSAVPVALVSNGMRVIVTGILAQYRGAEAAEGFFHEFAGMAVFGISVIMLIGISLLLRRLKGA